MFEELLEDRKNSFNTVAPGFAKRCYFDLFCKEIILFLNSLGRKNNRDFSGDYFVNEVKNSNMSRNLEKSRKASEIGGRNTLALEFYRIKRYRHLKTGFFRPIGLIIALSFSYFFILIPGLIVRNEYVLSFRLLIWGFRTFLKGTDFGSNRVFLMTDHHFFSSVIAMENVADTYVLQHGLILDKRFYYPIRAKHFCAWGKHSLKLLNNDPKALVTGTMKFSDIEAPAGKEIRKVVYCISSLQKDEVEKKIDIIYEVTQMLGLEFVVKCHPGSMFSLDYLLEKYKDKNIAFFKEEKIEDIDFDVAISENSTINIDFATMNKPFIIYDDDIGYFDEYRDVLAICNSKDGLIDVLNRLEETDFKGINARIVENELNGGLCTLF